MAVAYLLMTQKTYLNPMLLPDFVTIKYYNLYMDKCEKNGNALFHVTAATVNLLQQTLNGVSQISFSADGNVSPKKPTTLTEVAKQRELSGNLLTEADLKSKKQISSAKMEEISGHNIFGPPTEIQPPRSLAAAAQQEARRGSNRDMGEPAPRNLRTSVKVSNVRGNC